MTQRELPLVAALAGGAAFGAALALAGVAVARASGGGGDAKPSNGWGAILRGRQDMDAVGQLVGSERSSGTALRSSSVSTPEPQDGDAGPASRRQQQQQQQDDTFKQDNHTTPQRSRSRSRTDDNGAADAAAGSPYDQRRPAMAASDGGGGGGGSNAPLGPCFSMVSPVNAKKRSDPYDARPRENYLSWDDYFMAVAFLSAQRSKDPNKQVGAVIVGPDAVILSIGYNGFPRGCPDGALPWAKRSRGGGPLATKYPYVVHAEANALLNKNHASVAGAKVYVTMFPCNECAKLLIQAGVREVVYHEAKAEGAAAAMAAARGGHDCGSGGHDCSSGGGGGADAFPGFPAPGGSGSGNGGSAECKGTGGSGDEGWGAAAEGAGGGALEAGYVASRRLLTMAGVKLRQHRLKSMIVVNPATD